MEWEIIFWGAALVVFYTQLGYLGVTTLVAALLPRRSPRALEDLPRVTLIIPAHNEESLIAQKLENALAMDYPAEHLEFLVACDGCSDATVEIVKSFSDPRISVLEFQQRRGKASIMNDAASSAQGDVLCFCDANVMFQPDALTKLVQRLADPAVGAVSGDVRLASHESNFGEGETLYYRIERTLQAGESRIGSMMGVDGGMYVIRRELFEELRPDTILDDFVTTMNVIRQRKRIVYEPAAIATENGTPTAKMEFTRRVRVSGGAMQVLKRCGWPPLTRPIELWQFLSHKLLRWIEPVVLILLFTANAALWNEGIFFQVMFLGQALFYLLGAAATLILPLRETRIGGVIFYFVMSHVAMGMGIVKGLLNLQPVTWARTERSSISKTTRTAV